MFSLPKSCIFMSIKLAFSATVLQTVSGSASSIGDMSGEVRQCYVCYGVEPECDFNHRLGCSNFEIDRVGLGGGYCQALICLNCVTVTLTAGNTNCFQCAAPLRPSPLRRAPQRRPEAPVPFRQIDNVRRNVRLPVPVPAQFPRNVLVATILVMFLSMMPLSKISSFAFDRRTAHFVRFANSGEPHEGKWLTDSPFPVFTDRLSLDLSETGLRDVRPLAGQPQLKYLALRSTPVFDISPLAGLVRMISLDLTRTQVSVIDPVAGMVNLESLYLGQTKVSNVSSLSNSLALTRLDLSRTRVVDISPISRLVELVSLDLSYIHRLTDISPIAGLGKLTTLSLKYTNVVDLSPLAGLSGLKILDLSDLLNLEDSDIDISPLAGLVKLVSLKITSCFLVDISLLAGLVNLSSLDLSRNPISDISPLSGLVNLETLDLRFTSVVDLSPLKSLKKLRVIMLPCRDQIADMYWSLEIGVYRQCILRRWRSPIDILF